MEQAVTVNRDVTSEKGEPASDSWELAWHLQAGLGVVLLNTVSQNTSIRQGCGGYDRSKHKKTTVQSNLNLDKNINKIQTTEVTKHLPIVASVTAF